MFCAKCGNELKNNEQFCPKCGTGINASANSPMLNLSANDIKEKALKFKGNFVSGAAELGDKKRLFFIAVALLIVSMITSVIPQFKVSGLLGLSVSASMFDDDATLSTICVLLYLVSLFFLVFPLLFKKKWRPIYFLSGKIVTIVSFIFFLIVLLSGISESSDGIAEFSLTIWGVLYLLSTIGVIVLLFKFAFDYKKIQNTKIVYVNIPPAESGQDIRQEKNK